MRRPIKKRIAVKPPKNTNPIVSASAEVLFGCYICGGQILSDMCYVNILIFNPYENRAKSKYFHTDCFREVAGEEYL